MIIKVWIKPLITLIVIGLLVWFLPSSSPHPWLLINPKKIASMIFALTLIQVMGSLLNQSLGHKAGAILTGFLGGLISSTATTANLAKESLKKNSNPDRSILVFLATTLAMLFEALILVALGHQRLPWPVLIIFLGPIMMSILLIFSYSITQKSVNFEVQSEPFKILPILKLSLFIIGILLGSKVLQILFGQQGLLILTFLVSLFEIHGAVISNVQIYDNGVISLKLLTGLLTLSVIASYLSKLFLIHTLGHKNLKAAAIKVTTLLFVALGLCWVISMSL